MPNFATASRRVASVGFDRLGAPARVLRKDGTTIATRAVVTRLRGDLGRINQASYEVQVPLAAVEQLGHGDSIAVDGEGDFLVEATTGKDQDVWRVSARRRG